MTFDVSRIELADTASFTLKDAGLSEELVIDGKPVTVEVYSPGSEQGVNALHKSSRAAQMRMARLMRNEIKKDDAESAEREQAEKLTAFTKGFSDNLPMKPLDVYTNPRLVYISRQVEEFIGKYGNFSKGSSAS